MERQAHGFQFEDRIIQQKNLKPLGYTDNYDAVDSKGKYYQIKLVKYGRSIDMGDFFRQHVRSRNFYLIVGFWKDEPTNVVEIYQVYIDWIKWRELLSFDYAEVLDYWIRKKVSNDYSFDVAWKRGKKYFKKLYYSSRRLIRLRFKRDHKNQRRIQCAINNRDFRDIFVHCFVSRKIAC